MDGISPLYSTGHRPLLGLLPCYYKDVMLLNRQGKGIAVLMMPLGNLFLLTQRNTRRSGIVQAISVGNDGTIYANCDFRKGGIPDGF